MTSSPHNPPCPPPCLWVTRPEPDATRIAADLQAKGLGAHVEPLLHIHYLKNALTDDAIGRATHIITTSRHALHAVEGRLPKHLPLWVIGQRSRHEARKLGYTHVMEGGGNAQALLALLRQQGAMPHSQWLYLSGEETSTDLAGELTAAGFTISPVAVYRAERVKKASALLETRLHQGQLAGVVLYSANTARALREMIAHYGWEPDIWRMAVFCLSAPIAKEIMGCGFACVKVAPQPHHESLLAMVAEFQFT